MGRFIKFSYLFNKTIKFNLNVNAFEDIWIEITLPNNKKVIIGTIYRHPNHNINLFLNKLEKTMDKFNRNECTYYICVDINIDLKKNSSEILNYKNTLYSYGCKQYVSNNTHIVKNTPTSLLDHFYSNYEENTIFSHILLSDISDHLSIIIIIKNFRPLTNISIKYRRCTKHFDAEKFLVDLSENIYDCFEKFNKIFNSVLNIHAPLQNLSCKQKQLNGKPWLTKGILISIKIKNKLLQNMIKTKMEKHKKTISKI